VDAVKSGFGGSLLLWQGNGDGTLAYSTLLGGTASPVALIAADLNADGHQDLHHR